MSRRRRNVRKMWQDDEHGMPWWLGWAFVSIVVALWANRRRQERENRAEFLLSTTWTDASGPAAVPDVASPVAIVEDISIQPPDLASLEPAEPLDVAPEVAEASEGDSGEEQVEAVAPVERPVDNLTRIEGIGPKISSVLQAAGITTFTELADTDAEHVREILRAAGLNLADPTTWPDQARLAAAGDWEGLKRLQDNLKGGRPV